MLRLLFIVLIANIAVSLDGMARAGDIVLARAPFAALIGDKQVSFIAQRGNGGAQCVLEGSDLHTRHVPWSTFKIPNLLIALETGVAQDLNSHRAWDATRRPAGFGPEIWWQDHTLKTAFAASVVWYFRDIALEVGTARYRRILQDWSYGNAQVRADSDRFWLNEELLISPMEQVDFLMRILDGRVALKFETGAALLQAAEVASVDGVTLYAKTGAGPVKLQKHDGAYEGWYVGWVARKDAVPFSFSLYVRAGGYRAIRDFRKEFAVALLKECDALPATFLN